MMKTAKTVAAALLAVGVLTTTSAALAQRSDRDEVQAPRGDRIDEVQAPRGDRIDEVQAPRGDRIDEVQAPRGHGTEDVHTP